MSPSDAGCCTHQTQPFTLRVPPPTPAEGHPPKTWQRGPAPGSDPRAALRGQRRPSGPLGGDRAQASARSRRGGGRRGAPRPNTAPGRGAVPGRALPSALAPPAPGSARPHAGVAPGGSACLASAALTPCSQNDPRLPLRELGLQPRGGCSVRSRLTVGRLLETKTRSWQGDPRPHAVPPAPPAAGRSLPREPPAAPGGRAEPLRRSALTRTSPHTPASPPDSECLSPVSQTETL